MKKYLPHQQTLLAAVLGMAAFNASDIAATRHPERHRVDLGFAQDHHLRSEQRLFIPDPNQRAGTVLMARFTQDARPVSGRGSSRHPAVFLAADGSPRAVGEAQLKGGD